MDVRGADAEFRYTTWRNVLISVWSGAPTLERLRALSATERELLSRHPGGIGVFSVVDLESTKIPSMSDEVREETVRISREFGPRTLASAHVLEGTGFWVAAARSAHAGVQLLSRQKHPSKVFDSVDPASRWMIPLLAGKTVNISATGELSAAVQGLRRPRQAIAR